MEVEDEEGKIEAEESIDDDDEEMEMEGVDGAEQDEDGEEDDDNPVADNTFLDSFYGLSAADPKERSGSAGDAASLPFGHKRKF